MPLGYGGGPGRFGAGDRPGTRSVGALAPVGRVTARSPAPGPGSGLGNVGRAVCLAPRWNNRRPVAGSGRAKFSRPPRQAPVALRIWGSAHAEASRPVEGGGLMWSGTRVAAQAAYAATMKARTATFQFVEAVQAKSASGSWQSAMVTGSGRVDFAANSFAEKTMKSLVVNGAAGTEYIRVSAAARRQVPGHKAWVSIDLNKVRPGQASKSSPLAWAGDPTWALWHLLAVSSGVSQAGQATVAGVPATEYRAQVSLDKVAAKVQATEGARDAQLVRSEIKALSIASLPVEVWIDAHHLIRQIRFQAPVPAAATGGRSSGKAGATIIFTGFGAPVHFTPPPASQTADITNELSRQRAQGSSW